MDPLTAIAERRIQEAIERGEFDDHGLPYISRASVIWPGRGGGYYFSTNSSSHGVMSWK